MEVSAGLNNVHVTDSYEVVEWETMHVLLDAWRQRFIRCNTWKRSNKSLIREWRAHNLLYDLGLWRDRTKDVDLDYPEKWYTQIGYFVLSLFYLKGGFYC